MNRSLIVAISLFAAACGKDMATTPTTATSAPSTTQSTLTFTSTVTGSPVAVARVVVAGTAYTTNSDGLITLSPPAAAGATVDTFAPGYLDRATLLGSASTLTLWEIPAGTDLNFVRQLAYNRPGTPEVLWRPTAAAVYLRLTGELASDPELRAAHVRAAAMATAMTGGKVNLVVADPVAGGIVVTLLVNVSSQGSATTYLTQNGGGISAAQVEYANVAAARNPRVIAHELGHVLGFGHAPSGLMCASACGADDFGPADQAVFFSMLQRRPGTAPLDNDRALSARSEASIGVFKCDIR